MSTLIGVTLALSLAANIGQCQILVNCDLGLIDSDSIDKEFNPAHCATKSVTSATSAMKKIFLAPYPRSLAEIFHPPDLDHLRTLGELVVHEEAVVTDDVFEAHVTTADIIVGQMDLPESRLKRIPQLRAIFNVEGNFLPNVDYQCCFRRGIRVLTISPVFAEPVAELALGLAIDLGRGITRSDQDFREGTEQYGLEANRDVRSLFHQPVGFLGFGDLARALLPLLTPFRCRVRVYDPWLPRELITEAGCEACSLEDVLRQSRIIFVLASATLENKAFIGDPQFSQMQPGTIFVLLSRAAVVDFDALVRAAQVRHIRVATDVFPEEPLSQQHSARRTRNMLLSAHKGGALERTLKRIGSVVVADTELICRGLPPVMCKIAQPETVELFRGKPVVKS
jgi:phosphoglycerate dehydrogenase-like enzyme